MIPFLNIKLYKDSFQHLSHFVDKMKKHQLAIEEILEVDDLVLDIKQNSNTEFLPLYAYLNSNPSFSNEIIRRLIDYSTKEPLQATQSIGYKYPFNACQLLSSDNTAVMEYLMNVSSKDIDLIEEREEERGLIITTYDKFKYNELPEEAMLIRTGSRESSRVTYCNLDYFLTFLNSNLIENEVWMVLSGYFSEIFVHLLEVRGDDIIRYIFTYRLDVLDGLLRHVQFKSITECISNIFLFTSEDNEMQLMKYKQVFLEKILLKLSDSSNEKDNNEALCEMLESTLSCQKVYQVLLSYGPCINLLFKILFKAKESKVHLQAIQLITTLNDVILSLFRKKVTDNYQVESLVNIQEIYGLNLCLKITKFLQKKDNTQPYDIFTDASLGLVFKTIHEKGLVFLKDISNEGGLSGSFSVNSNTTYNSQQEVLGMNRLIQLRYLRTLIDIIVNSYANDFFNKELNGIILYLCDKGILVNAIDYFFKFQFNTLYQNIFIQIVSIICNSFSPKELIEHFFLQGELIGKVISFFKSETHFTFNSKRVILSGCFAPLIQICNIIAVSSNKWVKLQLSHNRTFCALYEILIKDVHRQYNSKLAYQDKSPSPDAKKPKSYLIDNFNKEVKQSSLSNYTIHELIKEELDLFKLYIEGNNVKERLDSLRTRLFSPRSETEGKDFSELVSVTTMKDTVNSHIDESINTNLDSCESEVDSMSSSFALTLLHESGIIKGENDYYDNSYWNSYPRTNQTFSVGALLNEAP